MKETTNVPVEARYFPRGGLVCVEDEELAVAAMMVSVKSERSFDVFGACSRELCGVADCGNMTIFMFIVSHIKQECGPRNDI